MLLLDVKKWLPLHLHTRVAGKKLHSIHQFLYVVKKRCVCKFLHGKKINYLICIIRFNFLTFNSSIRI